MPALHDLRRNAALSFAALPLSWWAERTYQAMPRLAASTATSLPFLSVIIPARNEEHNLPRLLASLQHLRYPGPLEIIVVNDGSTDHTATVAAAYGARVLTLDHLPAGWAGKPHACDAGARVAAGEWLLFTDADTIHMPDSAARAVTMAITQRLDGLSLFLQQASSGWLDRLALTAAYAGLFAGAEPQTRLFNGQYILLHRDVYWQSGGHAAVRAEALEDLALGQHLRRSRYRVPVYRGEDAATVYMYSDTRQLWGGMKRLGAESLRWGGVRTAWTALLVTALMSPLVVLIGVCTGQLRRRWLPTTWAAVALSMLPWARRFGARGWAVATPLGALLVQAAAVWGVINRLLGRGVSWKGRRV